MQPIDFGTWIYKNMTSRKHNFYLFGNIFRALSVHLEHLLSES